MASCFDAILFDVNGTLADDEPVIEQVIEDILRRHGRPPPEPRRDAEELIGRRDCEIFEMILGVGHPDVEPMVDELIGRYQDATDRTDPIIAQTTELVRSRQSVGLRWASSPAHTARPPCTR